MGHKVLQDHANVFCQMFVGWRMAEDLDTFASLPDGMLTIDVLTGTCFHDTVGIVDTFIAHEIAAWFHERLLQHHIPTNNIESATLHAALAKVVPPQDRNRGVQFNWRCSSEIKAHDRSYFSELNETHSWL
jgi:hypothetical protein